MCDVVSAYHAPTLNGKLLERSQQDRIAHGSSQKLIDGKQPKVETLCAVFLFLASSKNACSGSFLASKALFWRLVERGNSGCVDGCVNPHCKPSAINTSGDSQAKIVLLFLLVKCKSLRYDQATGTAIEMICPKIMQTKTACIDRKVGASGS